MPKYTINFWERVNYSKDVECEPEELEDFVNEIIDDGEFHPITNFVEVTDREYTEVLDEAGNSVDPYDLEIA